MNNTCTPLWEGTPPYAKGSDPACDIPSLTYYEPSKAIKRNAAVIVCPGGGYGNLAVDHEGHDIAKWLNQLGITAIILQYRMNRGGYQHPVPLLDAQQAIRTVRAKANDLEINPAKIGILGFSAGGHLASSAGTLHKFVDSSFENSLAEVSPRPDFMILCYPVITIGKSTSHQGSAKNLLGESPDPALLELLSTEKQVAPDTPPAFLWHTNEDLGVPSENSLEFYLAMKAAGVAAELHVYRTGGHGVGLANNIEGTRNWSLDCAAWLRAEGIL